MHFLVLIRFGKQEAWIARYIEPVGHVLAIGYPIVMGGMGVAKDLFSPLPMLPGWCWFHEYPQKCSETENVECLRDGGMGWEAAGTLPVFGLVFVVILVCMVLIILKVRDTERRMQQYAGSSDQNFERTKEVARQALLYISAFLLTYFPIAALRLAGTSARKNFAFALLVKTLSVMQGFFNAIIFLRNQYRVLTAQGEPLYFLRRLSFAQSWKKTLGDHQRAPVEIGSHVPTSASSSQCKTYKENDETERDGEQN